MTDETTLEIQELVSASGVPRRTVHFYVQQGILPPPLGAGLAARYTEDHLLRLLLIPVLRSQGLRLDEIRARFAEMTGEEMRRLLEKQPPAAQPAAPAAPAPSVQSIRERLEPFTPVRSTAWPEQRYLHYSLPGGITLSAPENLSPAERQRLEQLLQAARQIFNGGPIFFADSGHHSGSGTPTNGNDSQEEPKHG